MNIQIHINIYTREHDDTFFADAVREIVDFVRSKFPEMDWRRMDSPVVVTIKWDLISKPDQVVEP